MKAGIYYNKNFISDNKPNVEKIFAVLNAHGIECRVVEKFCDLIDLNVLFVLGGDGTILHIASQCAEYGVKIVGINYGHMGFLAEFEPDRLEETVLLAVSGNYRIQKRGMLEITCADKKFFALNDLVVQRNTCGERFTNTVNLRAEIDGTVVDNFSADGIIVSTPTGSTAYSLSAGGAVLSPELEAFILTPICAHSLHSRPIVFSDKSILKLKPVNVKVPLAIVVDGINVSDLLPDSEVIVTKSKKTAEFITSKDNNFFNKLLIKLNIWSK